MGQESEQRSSRRGAGCRVPGEGEQRGRKGGEGEAKEGWTLLTNRRMGFSPGWKELYRRTEKE